MGDVIRKDIIKYQKQVIARQRTGLATVTKERDELKARVDGLTDNLQEAESIKNAVIDWVKAEGFELDEEEGLSHPKLSHAYEEPFDGVGETIDQLFKDLDEETKRADDLAAQVKTLREALECPNPKMLEAGVNARSKETYGDTRQMVGKIFMAMGRQALATIEE